MRVPTRHFVTAEEVEAVYRSPDEGESVDDRRMRMARRRAALARFRERQRQIPDAGIALGGELTALRSGREPAAQYDSPDTYESPHDRRKRVARRRAAARRLRARLEREEGKEAEEEKVEESAVQRIQGRLRQEGDEEVEEMEESEEEKDEENGVAIQHIRAQLRQENGGEEENKNDADTWPMITQTRDRVRSSNTAIQAAHRRRMSESARARVRVADAIAHSENRRRQSQARALQSHRRAVKSIEEFNPDFASHILRQRENICQHCGAQLWEKESSSMCCVRGNVRLAPLPDTPPEMIQQCVRIYVYGRLSKRKHSTRSPVCE